MIHHLGVCPLCRRTSLLAYEICFDCLATLIREESLFAYCHHVCETCGAPLLHRDSVCAHDRIPALYRYRGKIRELLFAYEELGTVRLATTIAHLLSSEIERLCATFGNIALVPFPSSVKSNWRYGSDPMELIASKCVRKPKIDVLQLYGTSHRSRHDFDALLVVGDVVHSDSCIDASVELLKQRFHMPVRALCVAMD